MILSDRPPLPSCMISQDAQGLGPTPCLSDGSYSWGVDEIGTRSAQQFFHFLDCFANCTANHVVQLDLALQLNDSLICEIETLCQDCRNVQKYDGILFE
jgi:hypothetical protein